MIREEQQNTEMPGAESDQVCVEGDQDKKSVDEIVDGLTLFDDDLMRRVFERNIEATEQVLQIILGRKMKVKSIKGQYEICNALVKGRSITLDIHAVDEDEKQINIEVQNGSTGAHVRRARYHSSMLDTRMLKAKQEFTELKDSYVIFLYRHDKFSEGMPVYHVDRYVKETNKLFGDGSHIIYVNGNYKGDDEIGSLIHDFYQTDPEQIQNKALAEGVRYYKFEEGRKEVCEAVEKYGDQREITGKEIGKEIGKKQGAMAANRRAVENLMKRMAISLDQALNLLDIQGEERSVIAKQILR